LVAIALLVVSVVVLGAGLGEPSQAAHSPAHSLALGSALQWLSANQSSTGSYGSYFEHWTAAAAYALWLNDSQSQKAALSYSWLAEQLDSSSSWFWGEFGEADVPSEIIYSLSVSNNLALLSQASADYLRLLAFQEDDGGFRGFNNAPSSVDSAMALWGLISAGVMPASNQISAVEYLLLLQNTDGSFNLTATMEASRFSSLGPEPISMTALVTLALRNASYTISDSSVSRALSYLSQVASQDFNEHVYAAALSALAFKAFNQSADASKAVSFILSSQNDDGGFRDKIRSSEGSNALDTGWASIALQLVQPEPLRSPALNSLVLTVLVASVSVAAVAILRVVVFSHRRKRRVLTPA
jgi:hypothetical protein